ncbi:MAG TPA: phage/plasmid primase, P4 family [Allocoleopsis sp.]
MSLAKTKNLKLIKKTLHEPSKFKQNIEYHGKACFSQGYLKYGCLESWETALPILNNLPENENIFNELILENSKVKPYLDIEWFKDEFPKLNPDDIKFTLRKLIKDIFLECFDIEINSNDIYFSQCHRKKKDDFKFSFHVVISYHPSIVFENANCASFLARKLGEICQEYFDKSIIDLGVYKKTQNFRLVGHCKEGEFAPLALCNIEDDPLEHVVTNYDKNHIVLEVPEQKDLLFKEILNVKNNNLEEHLNLVVEKVKTVHPTSVFQKIDSVGFYQFNYTDRNELCFSNPDKCIVHDKIGFFAYIYNNLICIGCHSGNCVDSNNKKIIKVIGNVEENKDFNFEKVDFNNTFNNIDHNFIKECIRNGAIGISNLFEKMYLNPKRIKWINNSKQGSSYFWDGKLWQEDDYSFIERLLVMTVVRLLRNYLDTYNSNTELASSISPMIVKDTQALISKLNNGMLTNNILKFVKPLVRDQEFSKIKDIHPYRLSCKNGIVDLSTGEIRNSIPEDNITKCIDIEYDPKADSNDFDTFIKEITSNENGIDLDMYNFLRWSIGYSLQGQPKKKLFFILYGEHGFNGKSLLVNIICEVLEFYATTMDKSVVLESGGKKTAGSHSTEICQLENCRIGILSDTKENAVIDDGQMKQFTSISDKLSVREIYGKQKEFIPTFVPFINTNHPIHINLSDKAMYERFVIIPFTLSFVDEPMKSYERQANGSLYEKFKKNKKGILRWLVDASVYYHLNQDKPIPEFIKRAKELYNKQINPYIDFVEKTFLEVEDSTCVIKRKEMLQLFKDYSKENGIKYIAKVAEKEFDKILKCNTIKNIKCYTNLSPKYSDEEDDNLI